MGRQPGWILVAVMLAGQLVARIGELISGASRFTLVGSAVLVAIVVLQGLISIGRWHPKLLLCVQAVLVFAPYPWLGTVWGPVAGLLGAGIVLTLRACLAWPLFGAVLIAETTWNLLLDSAFSAVTTTVVDLNVGFTFFAAVYLVRQLERTARERERVAAMAVTTEQLDTAARLHQTLGAELGAIIREIRRAPGRADLIRIAESSRSALGTVRSVADAQRAAIPAPADTAQQPSQARFAWWFLLFLLLNCSAMPLANLTQLHVDWRGFALITALMIVSGALQLHHGAPRESDAEPRAWHWTLALHAVIVVLALVLPSWPAASTIAPFFLMFGAVVVRIRTAWAWALIVACTLVAAWTFQWHGIHFGWRIYWSVTSVVAAVYVYVLCRIPEVNRELYRTRAQALRMAVVAERLRMARDVHDLLGQTLSAITLKAELAARRPEDPAEALLELAQLADQALQEVRSITRGPAELSLAEEIATARSVLEATGAEVNVDVAPAPPDSRVLAIVLREAVTNIVRHSEADLASIHVIVDANSMRLVVTNNRVPLGKEVPERQGTGLSNMSSRLTDYGGVLVTERDSGRFTLTATLPQGMESAAGPVTANPPLSRV
ncbi:histidine kinase [Nocardia sp. NPDC052001]|uniref:sensor histidine kinase n=1 Tax=Nocardia sp. NPDC052001 TaxID=3154853 RepID=UPI00342B525E